MREKTLKRALTRTLQKRQGAALIAVLLLTMVLSGIGVVAVQNTFNSMELAGNYRLRRQAQETASGSLVLVGTRVGDASDIFYRRLAANPDERAFVFTGPSIQSEFLNTSGNETGLFRDPTDPSTVSFEADQALGTIDFSVVMRDPVDAPPPPGSDEFNGLCSKYVYMASRSSYDALERTGANVQRESNWNRPARAAAGVVGMTVMIDLSQCGTY